MDEKQHGGHNAGKPSPQANGSGPLWDARQQRGWTRAELSARAQVGSSTIQRAEQTGDWPHNAAHKAALVRALQADFLGWNTMSQRSYDFVPRGERVAVEIRTTSVNFSVDPPQLDNEFYLVTDEDEVDGVMLLHEAEAVDWILRAVVEDMAGTAYNLHEFLRSLGVDATHEDCVSTAYEGSPTPTQVKELNVGRSVDVSRIGPLTRDFLLGEGRWKPHQY